MSNLVERYGLADALFKQGQVEKAKGAYEQLISEDPKPVRALQMLAAISFSQNKNEEAIAYSEKLLEFDPNNLQILLAIGQACEKIGNLDQALSAYRRAALSHPGSALSYLFIGSVLQEKNDTETALKAYGLSFVLDRAILFLHEQQNVPPFIAERSRRAGALIEGKFADLQTKAIDDLETSLDADLSRIRKTCWYGTHQGALPYRDNLQRPEGNYIPGLDPEPVFGKEQFDWAEAIEAQYPEIREEILANLNLDADEDCRPYLTQGLNEHHPLSGLSGDKNWSSVHLYKEGMANDAALKRFPKTAAALRNVEHTTRNGLPLEIFVSALKPKTAIAPHFGLTNAGITVHLPIVIPEGDAAIRVGKEKHSWREGELFFFDDAFEHEAWNNTDELRIVLIFEVWNPNLTKAEQTALDTLVTHRAEWVESLKPADIL